MARIEAPVGFQPSGRGDTEIRRKIREIPTELLINPFLDKEYRDAVKLAWWEELALLSKDSDEEDAYREDEYRFPKVGFKHYDLKFVSERDRSVVVSKR